MLTVTYLVGGNWDCQDFWVRIAEVWERQWWLILSFSIKEKTSKSYMSTTTVEGLYIKLTSIVLSRFVSQLVSVVHVC